MQSEEVANVHFPEYTVQFGRLVVQEAQRCHCGPTDSNTFCQCTLCVPPGKVGQMHDILTIHGKPMKRDHTWSKENISVKDILFQESVLDLLLGISNVG